MALDGVYGGVSVHTDFSDMPFFEYEYDRTDYVMDKGIDFRSPASTAFVDGRLGGATFKFENGGFAVYTNGVKAGTLTFTPTP